MNVDMLIELGQAFGEHFPPRLTRKQKAYFLGIWRENLEAALTRFESIVAELGEEN